MELTPKTTASALLYGRLRYYSYLLTLVIVRKRISLLFIAYN
jgi:hypothetical protein